MGIRNSPDQWSSSQPPPPLLQNLQKHVATFSFKPCAPPLEKLQKQGGDCLRGTPLIMLAVARRLLEQTESRYHAHHQILSPWRSRCLDLHWCQVFESKVAPALLADQMWIWYVNTRAANWNHRRDWFALCIILKVGGNWQDQSIPVYI